MEKIKNHFKKNWGTYAGAVVVCILIAATLIYGYKLWNIDWNVPMTYQGGDDFSTLVNAKMFNEQAWNMQTDRMGAPYDAQFYDFTSSMMHNAGNLFLKVCTVLTPNIGVAVNIYFLGVFFLVGFPHGWHH
ncbi:MAG: hypothetical protein Q4F11_09135 [Eubacteriales bacterium]|nr:hypothetical protein [Eubacteriales bacterium]